MTAQTALQQAVNAWNAREGAERQEAADAAVALAEWGVFSVIHIVQITGLPMNFTQELIGKKDKTGGRFNAEMLPFLLDLQLQWKRDRPRAGYPASPELVRGAKFVMKGGCSAGMVERLTGVPRRTLTRWAAEGAAL